jgi:hypothetical protein
MSTTTTVREVPALERATDRLERAAGTAHACFDDLAAPGWDVFLQSRARFLDRPAPGGFAGAKVGLSAERRHGG